jgi:penicillin-binding protein activator
MNADRQQFKTIRVYKEGCILRIKRIFHLLVLFASVLPAAGCAHSVYVAPDSVTQIDDKYSDTDMRMMSEDMTRSLIKTPKIANASNPPVVAILDIGNKTSQHINTADITDKLMMAMLRSGRMRFVDRKILKDAAKELALSSNGMIDPAQAKKLGKMTAADLLLTGEITAINRVHARMSMTYYRLSMHLTDLETNEILWADETEIKKQAKKGIEDW